MSITLMKLRKENEKKYIQEPSISYLSISSHAWKRLNLRKPEHKFKDKKSYERHINLNISNKDREYLFNMPENKEKIIKIDHDLYPIIKSDGKLIAKTYIPKFMTREDPKELKERIEILQKIIASQRGTIEQLKKERSLIFTLLKKIKGAYLKYRNKTSK